MFSTSESSLYMCSWCVLRRSSSAGLPRGCNGRLFVPVWESLWGETAARRSRRAWKCSSPETPDNTPAPATVPANTTDCSSKHRFTLLETQEEEHSAHLSHKPQQQQPETSSPAKCQSRHNQRQQTQIPQKILPREAQPLQLELRPAREPRQDMG